MQCSRQVPFPLTVSRQSSAKLPQLGWNLLFSCVPESPWPPRVLASQACSTRPSIFDLPESGLGLCAIFCNIVIFLKYRIQGGAETEESK